MSVPSNLVPITILGLPEDPSPSDLGWMMYVNNGQTYKVQVNSVLNVSGVPTTRVVAAGTGLTGGGALSSNITISVATGGIGATQLDTTGITPGVYGDSGSFPVFTVDANGRLTAATSYPVPSTAGFVPTSRQVIAGSGLTGGGALSTNVTLSANLSNATPEPVGTEGPGTSSSISRSDHVHPAIDLADTTQTVNELDITRGGTGTALTAPPNGGIVYSDGTALQVSTVGTAGQVLASTGAGAPTWVSAPDILPVAANTVSAGPTSGPDANPTYRALVNADLPASGVSANTYGSASAVPVLAVNSKGIVTGVTNTAIAIGNSNLQYSSITIGSTPVSLGGTITTLTGTSISGATNTLTAIPNVSLDNSSITINGNSVSLGGSTTVTATATNALTIGTGLSGTSYNGSSAVTIAIANSGVTAATYGSASQVPVFAVNAQGQVTSVTNTNIAIAYTAVSGLGTAATLNAGVAGGVATLDGSGTVPTSQLPAAVLGALKYQGVWNASTNTPTLASGVGTQGYYYVVDVAGSTNLDGITDWKVGDWAIFNGSVWQKVDNTDAVTSVNGYTGTVVLTYSDVGAQPAGTYVTSVGATSPIASSGGTTPTISISQATTSTSGYLSSTDWNTFNGKQTAYTNLTTFGSLANAAGWLYNNGSGTLSYSTPTYSDVGAPSTSGTGATGTWAIDISGNAATATAASSATSATNATNIAVTADATNTSRYLAFTSATSGNNGVLADADLTYNPSTNTLTVGTLTATTGISGGTF